MKDYDLNLKLYPQNCRKDSTFVTLGQLKNLYIVEESVTLLELAQRYGLSLVTVETYAKQGNWDAEKRDCLSRGIVKLQNSQVQQAKKVLETDSKFKNLKIIQLEQQLEYFVKHMQTYGHLFAVSPSDGSLLKDVFGMPIPLRLPNFQKEIASLKEGLVTSDGLHGLLEKLEKLELEAKEQPKQIEGNKDIIAVDDFKELFEKEEKKC